MILLIWLQKSVGVSGLVVERQTRNFQVTGSNLTERHLQATLCKLLTYGVCSGQLSLLPFAGREMSSSLRATGWRPSVADCGSGMSACCTAGPIVR